MSSVYDPLFGIDVAEQVRKRQMLQNMPGIQGQQDPTPQAGPPQAPVAPPPTTQPQVPDSGTTITPWQTPEQAQPQVSPYKAQMEDINKGVTEMGQAGTELSKAKGEAPSLSQYKRSNLRTALLMPLQVLAGAGGVDTSKEFGRLIRPGYTTALKDYQTKVDAAQSKFDTLKETTKAKLDALKEEGVISKDQAEEMYRKAETDFKKQELVVRKQEADTARQNIQPLNQALEAIRLSNPDQKLTANDINREVENYWTAQEKSRMDAEVAKAKIDKIAREEARISSRQESNIAQDISKEQNRLTNILKPIVDGRQQMARLKAMRAEGDDNGFARLLTVIMADNSLNAATHGSVRQNAGIIQKLIESPGWLEYLKGKAQGILHPGKGSISEATMQQIDKIIDRMDSEMEAEEGPARKNLVDLNLLDPTEPSTRGRLAKIIDSQYDLPKSAPLSAPKTGGKLTPAEERLNKINEAIKKKLKGQ